MTHSRQFVVFPIKYPPVDFDMSNLEYVATVKNAMAYNNDPVEKLRALVDKAGGRPAFQDRAKISKQYLSNVLNRNKGFGTAAQTRIETALGLPPGYFRDDGAAAPLTFPTRFAALPILTWQDAGLPDAAGRALGRISVAGDFSPQAFVVKMESDAMVSPSPGDISLPPGVFVIVEPAAQPKSGDMVLARVEGSAQAFVRRLIEDGPSSYLAALNPKYGDLTKITDSVQLLGRVVGTYATF